MDRVLCERTELERRQKEICSKFIYSEATDATRKNETIGFPQTFLEINRLKDMYSSPAGLDLESEPSLVLVLSAACCVPLRKIPSLLWDLITPLG